MHCIHRIAISITYLQAACSNMEIFPVEINIACTVIIIETTFVNKNSVQLENSIHWLRFIKNEIR